MKATDSFSVDEDAVRLIFNLYAHFTEAVNSGETVCTFEKSGNFRCAKGNGTKHDRTVGDGFVSWYRDFASEIGGLCNCFNAHIQYT